MRFVFYLLSVVLVNANLINFFENWAAKHNINIEDDVIYNKNYLNWIENEKYIVETNNKNLTYTLAHNAYSGYSSKEFSQLMGFSNSRPNLRGVYLDNSTLVLDSIDWRSIVTSIKDQGQCGSCWAFSTIASVESAVAIKYGTLYTLSEQQLVDCDHKDHGCNGGLMDNAFSWIESNNGLCLEVDYPYVSGVTRSASQCQKTCFTVPETDIINFVDIPPNSDNAMMSALSLNPVSVAIEADQKDFQLYSSGVFTSKCGNKLDHGVALVGYGTMNGLDYYILRNSWGTSWGSNGYMYLGRGNDPLSGKSYNNGAGQCGVLSEGSYPIIN